MKNLNTEIYKEICKHYDHLIENMIEDGLKPFKDSKEEAEFWTSKETKKLAELRAMNVGQESFTVSVGTFNCKSTLEQTPILKRKFEQLIPRKEKHFYCTRVQEALEELTPVIPKLIVVNYSHKALAVFGETKKHKEDLKSIGAKFNPFLTHEGKKQAGWILPITKQETLNNLLSNI